MFVEQDVELGQLRQDVGQLQEEKEKASGRAEKPTEELEGEYFLVEDLIGVICLPDGTL